MQPDSWYYLLNGQQHGPAAEFEIQSAASANPGSEILVWQEGMDNWIPFGQAQQPQQATTFSQPSSALYSPYNTPTSPGYQLGAPKKTNGLAIASMIIGIISILGAFFFILPPILSIVFGHIALGQIKRDQNQDGGGMAIAGLILGYLCLIIGIIMISIMFFAVSQVNEHSKQFHEELQRAQQSKEEQIDWNIPDQE